MPSALHDQLVLHGAKWLRKKGFAVVATEIAVVGTAEQPDVIGFRSSCSAVIEVKVSRRDFLRDAEKPERNGEKTGLGRYRFYLCPEGMLSVDDLPPRWGLLYWDGRVITQVKVPLGNIWPDKPGFAGWDEFQHEIAFEQERAVLYSIARRLTSVNRGRCKPSPH